MGTIFVRIVIDISLEQNILKEVRKGRSLIRLVRFGCNKDLYIISGVHF